MDKEHLKLITAMVLGDGSLRTWKGTVKAAYSFGQISDHKDYIDWQIQFLEQFTSVSVYTYPAKTDKNGVNHKAHYKIETKTHPIYTLLRSRIYCGGKKSISLHDLELFDWQCAAIWYMDDGYRLKANDTYNDGCVFLCTDNYSHAEVIMLQKILYTKLGVAFNVTPRGNRKDGTKVYRLKARKEQAQRFIDGVQPFLFPSFVYKLYSKRELSFQEDNVIV